MDNTIGLEVSLFQNFEVRKVLYRDEWYFPIHDIVFVLTESRNVGDYIKKMRNRDATLKKGWGQIVTPL